MPPLHLPPQTRYTQPQLSATQNLMPIFGLTTVQQSVARSDPVTGAKRKLRKSYKGHIADLPGKNEIPTDHFILSLVHAPPPDPPVPIDQPLDRALLETVFTMDKTPETGVAGFDASVLGLIAGPSATAAATSSGVAVTTKKDKLAGSDAAATTAAAAAVGGGVSSAGEEKSRRRKRKSAGTGTATGDGSDVGLSTDTGGRRRKKRNV
ncbi:mediator complex, subunit Med19 [Lipomyces kononenkoae]|uniref:Mediator complex, subunit Med19 n=1 Tax=Lipomyces kononenkoae TaxID=34357 RepID=A0ACC3SUJ3_LIPKO